MSFASHCSASNPPKKHNTSQKESTRVDKSSTRLANANDMVNTSTTMKQPFVSKNAATASTLRKQNSIPKNVVETPTSRNEPTILIESIREQPFVTEDEPTFDVSQSPSRHIMEDDDMEEMMEDIYMDMKEFSEDQLPPAKLKKDKKLPIEFIDGRAAGPYGKVFASQLGVIVCDPNIMLVRVLKWKCLTEVELDHLWEAAQDVINAAYEANPDATE
ncbi:hypothetical protein LINGRAHAP2_LOCUS9404 [Linum grandiflorum]